MDSTRRPTTLLLRAQPLASVSASLRSRARGRASTVHADLCAVPPSPRASLVWGARLVAGAALLAGCSEPTSAPSAAPPSPLVDEARAALRDDDVWITTDRDSVELVRRVVGAAAARLERRDSPAGRDEVALRVPRASLPDISEIEHEERHRCGGFMLQESEAEAMAALGDSDAFQKNQFFLAPSYTIDNAATVDKLLPELQEPNVLATIRKLSAFRNRFHTSATGEEAALSIRDTWKALSAGRDDITVELVDHQKTPQPSIKLTIRGTSLPDELVVLGGHMDSISGRGSASAVAPGADDNASGIATLTEIARAAVALDYRPARTVVFYGYAAEEVGLVGSAEIAARAKTEGLNVIGVMQLDMTNFTSAPTPFIGLLTDFVDKTLTEFSAKLIDRYVHVPYKYFECGYGCSDHASWTKSGFPATSPHEADMEQSNQRIHTTSDTLALSKDSAAHSMHFARFGVAFMAELAKGKLGVDRVEPACDANKACPTGQRCDSGMCVVGADAGSDQCSASADCASGQLCVSGRCSADDKPSPACSDAAPCPTDLTCVAGVCVVATGATGKRDAGAGQRDASVRADGGSRTTTTTTSEPIEEADADDDAREGDSVDVPVSRSAGGCGIAAVGQTPSSAWLLVATALGTSARTRRRRKR